MFKKILSISLVLVLIFGLIGCSQNQTQEANNNNQNQQTASLEEVVIGSSPGPVSYPLAYMLENQNTSYKIKAEPWKKYEQLIAMITAEQVHLASTPLTNAIMLYNKGFDIKLVNVSVWGMLYVVSTDNSVKEIADLKGKEIAVAGQGGIHDLVLKHLLIQNNLDPDKDINITYMDLPEASAKLVTGELEYAVLNEPNSSMAFMNAQKAGVELFRVLDLQKEWGKVTGSDANRIPQAGFIMIGNSGITPEAVIEFNESFLNASKWVNENPAEAGPIVEKYFEWMKAPAVQQSLEYARLEPVPATEAKEEIELFFTELMKTAPSEVIGGKLPDEQFYFEP